MVTRRFFALLSPTLGAAVLSVVAHAAPEWNGPAFQGEPPDSRRPWAIHDRNRPQPKRIEPGTPSTQTQPGKPPSDAIVLFDGTPASLAKWESDAPERGPTKWIVKDGALECVPRQGGIQSKETFGDCQLHLEWAAPTTIVGDSQGRGNSGIFLMGICEVQILDSYNNPSYADGSANSIYGVSPPLVNAIRKPGEFQSVDIIFRRPIFKDGKMVEAGYVTVICNGVVVQDHVPIVGENYNKIGWRDRVYPSAGPLKFQDHGNPVRLRNIWYRPLPPRPIEGGTDGVLTPEATAAKRKEIAASIRSDAATMKNDSPAYMLRLGESLVYEAHDATARDFDQLAVQYVESVSKLSGDAAEKKKGEIMSVRNAFAYIARHKLAAGAAVPKAALDRFVTAQGWDEPTAAKKKKQKA